jgi:hypothetical protein
VLATHFGASLATFDVEIFLSSSLLAVFWTFWPDIGHSGRESLLSADAILGSTESVAQNNQQNLCVVASIPFLPFALERDYFGLVFTLLRNLDGRWRPSRSRSAQKVCSLDFLIGSEAERPFEAAESRETMAGWRRASP